MQHWDSMQHQVDRRMAHMVGKLMQHMHLVGKHDCRDVSAAPFLFGADFLIASVSCFEIFFASLVCLRVHIDVHAHDFGCGFVHDVLHRKSENANVNVNEELVAVQSWKQEDKDMDKNMEDMHEEEAEDNDEVDSDARNDVVVVVDSVRVRVV